VKVGKILNKMKFGTADGPRVRGGRSAVHENCSPVALQSYFGPQSCEADGPRVSGGWSAVHMD
jgi:hypothetical protein